MKLKDTIKNFFPNKKLITVFRLEEEVDDQRHTMGIFNSLENAKKAAEFEMKYKGLSHLGWVIRKDISTPDLKEYYELNDSSAYSRSYYVFEEEVLYNYK